MKAVFFIDFRLIQRNAPIDLCRNQKNTSRKMATKLPAVTEGVAKLAVDSKTSPVTVPGSAGNGVGKPRHGLICSF